jgi:hypothetical protein
MDNSSAGTAGWDSFAGGGLRRGVVSASRSRFHWCFRGVGWGMRLCAHRDKWQSAAACGTTQLNQIRTAAISTLASTFAP